MKSEICLAQGKCSFRRWSERKGDEKSSGKTGSIYEKESLAADKKTAGKIVLATVKGDVHDIGKNIVGVVLSCNNYLGN